MYIFIYLLFFLFNHILCTNLIDCVDRKNPTQGTTAPNYGLVVSAIVKYNTAKIYVIIIINIFLRVDVSHALSASTSLFLFSKSFILFFHLIFLFFKSSFIFIVGYYYFFYFTSFFTVRIDISFGFDDMNIIIFV